MKTIFISDVHIGTNIPENWYQESVHQPYLKAILQYIQSNAQNIQDVVMLGDWFDSWMYPPQPQISATVTQIINSNLAIFTKQSDGDFITCMDSIHGNLYYVNGNHDMTINCADVNSCINNINGRSKTDKQVVSTVNHTIYSSNSGIYAEHGHAYSLLCRPYMNSTNTYPPLPLGYFISRIAALYCQQQLQKTGKQNSSQLPGQGNPDMSSILKTFISNPPNEYGSFAHEIMVSLAKLVGYNLNNLSKLIFTMPDQSSISADKVEKLYPDIIKTQDDLTSLLTVDANNSLDNQGENLCFSSYNGVKNKVVVMGHTHVPVFKSHGFGSLTAIYANSGFLCPAIPDINAGKMSMTFTEVEQNGSHFTVTVKKVNYPNVNITTLFHASI